MFVRSTLGWVVLAVVWATGCGDSGPTAPPPAPAPSQAVISVGVDSPSVSAGPGGGVTLALGVVLTETGGVGSNIAWIRVEALDAGGGATQRSEMGADRITAATGDNRIEARTTEILRVELPFSAPLPSGQSMRVTVRFQPDAGERFESTAGFVL